MRELSGIQSGFTIDF